ncbi:nuclear transport factor 2 family protein [Agromyces sp. SYSU T00266]|uniref:nuclear transport factor 2 family protein n=1 Tax=Agromyces zhanjiangensis TaxID=3158562 RepID=UPI003398FC3A
MLSEEDLDLALRRHWEYEGVDYDISHEIYDDDAVLEFPQSGERFEGLHNFKEWRSQYPAKLKFHIRRITHRDDLVVAENLISYDGNPWMYTVNLMEFRGEKIAHERIYVMDGWPAAEWRAPWRAATDADPPAPPL